MRGIKNITRNVLLIILSFIMTECNSIDPEYLTEIEGFQANLNSQFANPLESPLTKEDLSEFSELEFFPIDPKYRVEAEFIRTPNEKSFEMPTSTERKPIYKKFGEAHFEIDGKKLTLSIYQNQDLVNIDNYKDYLFLPFKDLTNGKESYGGGRFIDLIIPDVNIIVIDFNIAYNPLCAYNHKYSCPIPPAENHLDVEINAGVMAFADGH